MNHFESLKTTVGATIGIFLIPVFICLVFKYTSLTSIGPVVFFYSLLSLPIFCILFSTFLNSKFNNYIGTTLGISLGVLFAVLILNFFMAATYYAGIMNYDPR